MSGADAFILLLLFYSLVFGLRRGFWKEVVHAVALVVAIVAAIRARPQVGAWLASRSGAPHLAAEVGAVVLVWAVTFFAVALVGRLLLKKLRGKGVDDNLDESAEAVADAIAGDTTKGPVTLLTDPIASKRGLFYWSDKLLGGGLGLAKGALTAITLCGVVVYADRLGWETALAGSVESSLSARLFHTSCEPYLETIPEYRLVRSVDEVKLIGDQIRQHPDRLDIVTEHPELQAVAQDPTLRELAADPDVRRAWEEQDVPALLRHERVQAALGDEALRSKLAAVAWEKVHEDVAAERRRSVAGEDGAPPPGEAPGAE